MAVVVSVIAAMGIGFLWYGVLFQQQWMAGNGITMEGEKYLKNGAEMPMSSMPMVYNIISMALNALIVNWLIGRKSGASSWMDGAQVGGAVGVVMAVGIFVGNTFAGNPHSLALIDGSYSLVIFTAIGAILGGWQKK